MKAMMVLALAAIVLSGCGRLPFLDRGIGLGGLRGTPSEVEGIRFRSRVAAQDGDARSFAVSTRKANLALPQALEAGRIEGMRFCLKQFGGTEIAWAQGPDRPPAQVVLEADGDLVLTGRCLSR